MWDRHCKWTTKKLGESSRLVTESALFLNLKKKTRERFEQKERERKKNSNLQHNNITTNDLETDLSNSYFLDRKYTTVACPCNQFKKAVLRTYKMTCCYVLLQTVLLYIFIDKIFEVFFPQCFWCFAKHTLHNYVRGCLVFYDIELYSPLTQTRAHTHTHTTFHR